MKKFLTLLLSLSMFFFAMTVFAQGRGSMHGKQGGMEGWFNESVLKEVGVSDTIRKQVREIAFQAKKDMMDNQFQIREKRIALHKEYLKSNLDEGKIESLSQEIWNLQKNQMMKIEKAKLAIAKLLTPEQREKLSQLIFDRKRDFWGKMRYMDD